MGEVGVGTALLVVLAGMVAGVVNTVVGSGTLITFPLLLSAGVPPVAANVANNIGLAPGSVSGAVGYRHELRMRRAPLLRLCGAALAGGAVGAALLAVLPAAWFQRVAPFLVGFAVVLVIVEPWLKKRFHTGAGDQGASVGGGARRALPAVVFATSVYGGYFGAGQGVILLAAMTVLMSEALQQVNAVKNILQAVDNLTSAAVFAIVADPDWTLVALLAIGAVVGGQLGARLGRRLPPTLLRAAIVTIGILGIIQLSR